MTVQMLNWMTVKIRSKSCSSDVTLHIHRNFSSGGIQKKLFCTNGHVCFCLHLRMGLLSKMLEREKKYKAKGYGILLKR